MFKRLLPILLLLMLQGCAGLSIIDESSYALLARDLSNELSKHNLPVSKDEYQSALTSSGEPYGQILFNQLAPNFMQGQMAQYYIGETFADTMQPRRSKVVMSKNGFEITHVSQIIKVEMIAITDWNNDGDKEWLVSCHVTQRTGSHQKTWYLLVPPPLNSSEILQGTPFAVKDCKGSACTIDIRKDPKTFRQKNADNLPKTIVNEYRPGEATVTTPPTDKPQNTSDVLEQSI